MKSFDLSTFEKTPFYCHHHYKGTIFDELAAVEALLKEINTLFLENKNSVSMENPILNYKLKMKLKYAQKLIDIFEGKVKDKAACKFDDFLYQDIKGKSICFRDVFEDFSKSLPTIIAYIYQAKNYIVEIEMLLAENNTAEEVLAEKNQHLAAIVQSLMPSPKSVASLFVPQLLASIEKHSNLMNKLTQEEINTIVNQSCQGLADYLYKQENGMAVNMLNGMREHYLQQLSEYEKLYHQDIKTKALLKQAQEANLQSLKKMEANRAKTDKRIIELEEALAQKNEALKEKGIIIDRMEGTLEAQKELISNQIEELLQLHNSSPQLTKKHSCPSKDTEKENNKNGNANFSLFQAAIEDRNKEKKEKEKKPFAPFEISSAKP
ncbi:MAG: hypothetical protein H2069_03470 [Legionella sp.]|nr:hypothetical protein [Legionella sp.]